MELFDLLEPIDLKEIIDRNRLTINQWAHQITYNVEQDGLDITEFDIAIVGLSPFSEDIDKSNNSNVNAIRKELYQLYNWEKNLSCIDLGNVKTGKSKLDNMYALSEVCNYLLKNNVIPIIIGGTHDYTYGQFLAYEESDYPVNMICFDERIDLHSSSSKIDAKSFLYNILRNEKQVLHNFIHAGFQMYLNDPQMTSTLEKLHFECFRLGHLTENSKRMEPLVRDINLFSLDTSVISSSDAPGQLFNSPNGLTGVQACQLARYAGLSDQINSFGLYEFYDDKDIDNKTAKLLAQMIWHFTEAYYERKFEEPKVSEEGYMRYTVPFDDADQDLVFLRSKVSERWWMKVPVNQNELNSDFEIVPCLYEDYIQASKNEIPERWMSTFIKHSKN